MGDSWLAGLVNSAVRNVAANYPVKPPAGKPAEAAADPCVQVSADEYVPSTQPANAQTDWNESVASRRQDFETKIIKLTDLFSIYDGSKAKKTEIVDMIISLNEEVAVLSPKERAALMWGLRDQFYRALNDGDFIKAGMVLAAFQDSPELNKANFLPQNPTEAAAMRKTAAKMMNFKAVLFKDQYIDSKKYKWGWQDGYTTTDGGVNSNGKISCIDFTLLFLMEVLGNRQLEKTGKAKIINMAGKTGVDLPAMFAIKFDPLIDPKGDFNLLVNKLISDVKKDGIGMYACQLYTYDAQGKEQPKHAFVVIAAPVMNSSNQYNLVYLESTPAGVRMSPLPPLLKKYDGYINIKMVPLVPADAAGQLALFAGGNSGYNLPKGKEAAP